MNYFAHAVSHLERPYFVAGTALPDWLSVADRRVRLRPKHLAPYVGGADSLAADLAKGAQRHLDDDAWFHTTRGFVEASAELGLLFRERLRGSDGFRCGFLGHVVLELLLDAELIARYPDRLDRYYAILEEVDPGRLARSVAELAARPAERLEWFVALFVREQVLRDYADDARLLWRLNQVLGRVKLTPLPEAAEDWIAESRERVRRRVPELLPAELFPWPDP